MYIREVSHVITLSSIFDKIWVAWRSTPTWRFCHSHWHQSSWRRPCTPHQCSGGGPMPSWISLEVRLWVCWERECVWDFFFCLITCVCENLDYELWVQFFNICCDFGLILFGLGLTNWVWNWLDQLGVNCVTQFLILFYYDS